MAASSFANRFLVAAANATLICLVANIGCIIGFFVFDIVNSSNLLELLLPPGLLLAVSLRPGVHEMQWLLLGFHFLWFLLLTIFAPAFMCAVSMKFNRQEMSAVLSDVLTRALKLGLWSVLLTAVVTVPTVMLLDHVFTDWSIAYFCARIWLAPLVYLLALTLVQLILRSENEFVLPKFCSISEKEASRSPALICVVSFLVTISIFLGTYFLTPIFYGPFLRHSENYLFIFELLAWLLAGLCLVRIMNRENFMLVYFFFFVLPSLVLFTVMPALMTIISIH